MEHPCDAYFAGLFDGEAYISVMSLTRGTRKRPVISIHMTDENILNICASRFGSTVRRVPPHKGTRPHHKPVWNWRVSGVRAQAVIRDVFPFLIIKRIAAQGVLDWVPKDNRRMIAVGSETKSLTEWAAATGIKYRTLQLRLEKGWTEQNAILTAVGQGRPSRARFNELRGIS